MQGGIGEEDIVYIVLPYIHSAREGVQRLGSILEKYGTYEMNGIAFEDVNRDLVAGNNRWTSLDCQKKCRMRFMW